MEQPIDTPSSTSSSAAAAAATRDTNQLQRILDSFQQQMLRLDDLEAKVEARTAATRRRVANLLTVMQQEQQQQEQPHAAPTTHSMPWPVRHSHLRMWVTHLHEPSKTTTVSTSLSEQPYAESGGDRSWLSSSPETTIIPETFTLQIEGKLLIGHLDHASANNFDRKTGYTPPTDDTLDRSKGEKEDDVAVPEWNLTQLFERVTVTFQTVYQPKIHPMARILPSSSSSASSPAAGSSSKTKKSSRRSSSAAAPAPGLPLTQDPDQVDFRKCLLSKRQVITWTHNMALQEDAHAWAFHYTPPSPVSGAYEVHSVICHIQLVPRRWYPQEERYVILSPVLGEHLFPHQTVPPPSGEETEERQEGHSQQAPQTDSANSSNKKRKADDMSEATTADGHPFPPVHPEILIPATPLLLSEILFAISIYIRDRQLVDPEDRSTILVSNDNMLQQVLGGGSGGDSIERLHFSKLQEALLRANAIAPEVSPQRQYPRAPVQATYIMRQDTAWKDVSQHADSKSTSAAAAAATTTTTAGTSVPALWQWDMECSVPVLFAFRARQLLRRIKRRELEYSSSRTKARYLLQSQQQQQRRSKEEEYIRQQIEAVVANKSLAPALQPVLWALAKGAATSGGGGGGGGGDNISHDQPEHATTEAQRACQLDQQISYLLFEQLPRHCRAAQEARELVTACLGLGEP